MPKRFVSIWFRHLTTDWMVRRRPELKDIPFALAAPERGRMVIKAVNLSAQSQGVYAGMVVADCRAILPELMVIDDLPGQADKLLTALAEWCIRFTPVAAIDLPDGLILDVSGCTHLWGGEQPYLKDIHARLTAFGYDIRLAIADTPGTAWAVSRYGQVSPIVEPGKQLAALMPLPAIALRLEPTIVARLQKLGLYQLQSFIKMPRAALRRRFGQSILTRLDQALGQVEEWIKPVVPIQPHQERLPSLEPVSTAKGIEIALRQLLVKLCLGFSQEGIGLRACLFRCYRIDGKIQQITIGTSKASRNADHLFKLFENKIVTLEPDLGFELFLLEATEVEEIPVTQDALWETKHHDDTEIAELLDRLSGKVGSDSIRRYLPQQHYWPERSIKVAASLQEQAATDWRTDLPRPLHLLGTPEPIEVTVPIPDYPPMLFHYKGKLHNIKKADGPERIEQEWWIEQGLYRDYYCVEDENGARYWLFRLGHYNSSQPKWFIHGFFA